MREVIAAIGLVFLVLIPGSAFAYWAPVKVLPKLKIAHIIGRAVSEQRGDIRDVISIGKLVRKNDGPEEVEQILSTMTKYGNERALN